MTTATGLRAIFLDCTLERSPQQSPTFSLTDRAMSLMTASGVAVDDVRAVDHDIAPGVHEDMTDYGWAFDEWPALQDAVLAADILVLTTPTWLGDTSSVCSRVLERMYGFLCDRGPEVYYGRVAGCLAAGDGEGVTRAVANALGTLQQLGYTIPPHVGTGGDPTVMVRNLVLVAQLLKQSGGLPTGRN